MTVRKHVVITGTGRTGTTFLVELLTNLGLDTGFTPENMHLRKDKEGRAGLEMDIRSDDSPFIVKSPWFCDYAQEVLQNPNIIIEHIFIPMRNLYAAAQSRRYVSLSNLSKLSFEAQHEVINKGIAFRGGLWYTQSHEPGQQEVILLKQFYKLMFALSGTDIPITFMRYPRITKDCSYLFNRLNPILKDIDFDYFSEVFNQTVRPELVHSFSQADR